MKRRGSLFFIGLISAIITIISLNVAFGRSGYYNERYLYFSRYRHCDNGYDNRYRDDKKYHDEKQQRTDSLHSNY